MKLTNWTNWEHAAWAVGIQLAMYMFLGDYLIGAVAGVAVFIGREHAQAEYHWIATFGKGKRENMPWWGGFDYRAWKLDALMDWLVPLLSVTAVSIAIHFWL